MELHFSAADEDFRQEVRDFLARELPEDIARRHALGYHPVPKDDLVRWTQILARRGWSTPHWPLAQGGTGWSAIQHHIFEEECHRYHAPDPAWAGIRLCAPVICEFGNEAQKAKFLPPTRNAEFFWAQGFSEPNAGSDLASLKTSAVKGVDAQGAHYMVNGQKVWSSEGHYANWGFFLVRTDSSVKPQRGISFLLIDMSSPGVTVRPIVMFNGMHYVNEIFLDNVRVPADNLIGEEGAGWTHAKFLLDNERASSAFIYFSRQWITRARTIAAREQVGQQSLLEQPAFARKLAALEVDLQALEYSVLRVLADEKSPWHATAVASGLKVRGSEIQQRATELAFEALGPRALRAIDTLLDPCIAAARTDAELAQRWPEDLPGVASCMLQTRAVTLYGGAKEVQKNIIAKLAFNL